MVIVRFHPLLASRCVGKENPHPLKETDAGHKLKRIVTRKLSNRRKRQTIDGWRLSDKEFDDELNII